MGSMARPVIILTSPEELLKARLNQPRVSSESLRRRRLEHRLASEASAEVAKNANLKAGRVKVTAG